jgi:hypothetical protein
MTSISIDHGGRIVADHECIGQINHSKKAGFLVLQLHGEVSVIPHAPFNDLIPALIFQHQIKMQSKRPNTASD